MLRKLCKWVIPCEITHSKYESLPIVFILSTQMNHQNFFSKYVTRATPSGSYSKISSSALLHKIVKFQKH